MPAKKFYRTEIVQVVLHDFPIPEPTADDLNYEDSDVRGSVHGRITSAVSRELTRKELYDALQARDTDAGLFLDAHDVFVCSLGPGDTVTVSSRQTETGPIGAVDFLASDRVVIRWPDGSRVECGFKDIKAGT